MMQVPTLRVTGAAWSTIPAIEGVVLLITQEYSPALEKVMAVNVSLFSAVVVKKMPSLYQVYVFEEIELSMFNSIVTGERSVAPTLFGLPIV